MPAPVKQTCPKVDKAVKLVKDIQGDIDVELTERQVKGIISDLKDVIYYFEELRQDNDYLRTWAHECEDENNKLQEEINSLENQLEGQKQSS